MLVLVYSVFKIFRARGRNRHCSSKMSRDCLMVMPLKQWIPAFAGMTFRVFRYFLQRRLQEDDDFLRSDFAPSLPLLRLKR